MITEDQTGIVEALSNGSLLDASHVERIDTHSAMVFLAGDRAWKLKRAVRFDYLDFSTAALRRVHSEREVALNRRTAPALYRGVAAITRDEHGRLALNGAGPAVDWLVEMNRFDQDQLFDRLAVCGRLDHAAIASLASAVARFHRDAERRADLGGWAAMQRVVEGNAEGLIEFATGLAPNETIADVNAAMRGALARVAPALEARREGGFVRQCHGDLHLGNIVLLGGEPVLFDAIEFNDDLACTDVKYDAAFLVMDLWHRGLPALANAFWNTYLQESGDLGGLELMPFFLACRAAVRAKTSATVAAMTPDVRANAAAREAAREYLALCLELLCPPRASLIAIGGLSGTGKSTLAAALAPLIGAVPGAVVVRSDVVRKRLSGVAFDQPLPPSAYTADMSEQVYRTVRSIARLAAGSGQTVIVDAVSARPSDRTAIEQIAADLHLPFRGIWLEAPVRNLLARVERRRGDASDADAEVVRRQAAKDPGTIAWSRIETARSVEGVCRAAIAYLEGTRLPVRHSAEQKVGATLTAAL